MGEPDRYAPHMPIRGSSYDILGVSVGRVGAVQDLVHVELNEGVTAFYGANGVGKSQILQLVEHALRGTSPASSAEVGRTVLDVHLQFHDDLQYSTRGWGKANEDFLVEALVDTERRVAADLRERDLAVPSKDTPLLERLLDAQNGVLGAERQERSQESSDSPDRALIRLEAVAWYPALRSAARERRLTFRAVGTVDAPRWQIMLACDASSLLKADEIARSEWETSKDRRAARPPALGSPADGAYWSEDHPERGSRVPRARITSPPSPPGPRIGPSTSGRGPCHARHHRDPAWASREDHLHHQRVDARVRRCHRHQRRERRARR